MDIREGVEVVGLLIDLCGVAVIVVAVVGSAIFFGLRLTRRRSFDEAFRALRRSMGRGILLGLELLVAGDIIRTVAIEPTLSNVAVLAVIVAVRTFLSFSLEVELSGRWPWERGTGPASPPAA